MIKLLHIDTNYEEGTRIPDSFVAFIKNKLKSKLVVRVPLVFRVPSFYDVYWDAFKTDIWCTPVVCFTQRYPGQVEVYYNIQMPLEGQ